MNALLPPVRCWFLLAAVALFPWPDRAAAHQDLPMGEHERAIDALPQSDLAIRTGDGDRLTFSVELARSPEERARGLMFRRTLGEHAGMLFDFGSENMVSMWMKNTFIPLDMLFIDNAGIVRHIHENAKPHDETPISSGVPVRAVLELNAGTVGRLGIREQDHVIHEIFALTDAAKGARPDS